MAKEEPEWSPYEASNGGGNSANSDNNKSGGEREGRRGEGVLDETPRGSRFRHWTGYNIKQLKYALGFINEAVGSGKISEVLRIYGKELAEEGKRYGNQQGAVDDLVAKMEARLKKLEKDAKTPADNNELPSNLEFEDLGPSVETTKSIEQRLNELEERIKRQRAELDASEKELAALRAEAAKAESGKAKSEEPKLEIPKVVPIPEPEKKDAGDVPPADPKREEPVQGKKPMIENGDMRKLREMYEVASREEQKKPRWGWLKERLKGLATFGWWESHLAEKFRTGTKKAAKEAEAGMKDIKNMSSLEAVGTDLDSLGLMQKNIDELKHKLEIINKAVSEGRIGDDLGIYGKDINEEGKKFGNQQKAVDDLVAKMEAKLKQLEADLAEAKEKRRKQEQEIIRRLQVHGIEGFETYVATLLAMEDGPAKQLALENLTKINTILDGVEERLRADLGKHRGGLLKRVFGEQDKTYGGAELLTNEKLARVKRDIFERCIAIQQGQIERDQESIKTIIRKNLDPDWWKRYVATGVEIALGAIALKFALAPGATDYGPLTIGTHPPVPVPGAEQIGMHKTVWGTTKQYLIDKCGIPNPTDAQVMDASKTVLQQNNLFEQAWQVVKGAKSSRVLPEGFKLLFNKSAIMASL